MQLTIARYTIAYGNTDKVLALLPQVEAASRLEPGCISYDSYIKLSDEHQVVLIERYESAHALAAHRETEHFTAIVLKQIIPLLSSREVETHEV
jgi:quinol monooxygenase YgiN